MMNVNDSYTLLVRILEARNINEIPHSPVVKLNHFGNDTQQCYIKRDDMIGGLCNGSKQRKFLSLLPYLIEQKYTEVVVVGGAYSNNVTALVPLLIQNNIKPILFLRGDPHTVLTGNFLHTRLFIPEEDIHWISRERWTFVGQQAENYINNTSHKHTAIIPEGACMPEALWGSLTLPLDIMLNQEQLSVQFDHIFIEAGTGGTAAALIIGLAILKLNKTVHVLLLSDDEQQFLSTLTLFQRHYEQQLHVHIDLSVIMETIIFHTPTLYKSFGAVGSCLFHTIVKQARTNGIVLDPIYAAKLVMAGQDIIQQHSMTGNMLFIHNGGTLSLMGYQQQIIKALSTYQDDCQ